MLRSDSDLSISAQDILPKEANGKQIAYKKNIFVNWGGTVKNKTSNIFYPRSKEGIKNIVTWAKSVGKTVRVAGYRHSWASLFSDDNQVIISMLDDSEVFSMPTVHKKLDKANPFQSIELIGKQFKENGKLKHLCKIGSATTSEQFRLWVMNSYKTKGTKQSWTLPLNVIMVENSFGGTNAVACHGAGLKNKTISDLVTEIEFVNANGELQKIGYNIDDSEEKQRLGKELIKSASACFGMLGVVTSLTFKLDQLSHARMLHSKPRLALTIPPPADMKLPKFIPEEVMKDVTPEDLKKAEEDFISHCENDYYSEWFWFSLHDRCWVNCWKNNGDEKKSIDFPSPKAARQQEIMEYVAELTNHSVMKLLSQKWQAKLLSDAAMLMLPAGEEIITPLINGLHFQRGIQNMHVQDMEFEIPIPALPNGKPDWSICQRAWWDAIITVYEWMEKKGKVPMRLPLEMRIIGGSDVTLAPEHGNTYGTCSIEVLTLEAGLVDKHEWKAFMQAITNKWSRYTDHHGKPLNIRPHWAKQWEGLTIERPGEVRKDMIDYIKEDAYKPQIETFNKHLEIIAKQGGYTKDDLQMFSNPLLTSLFSQKPKLEKKEIEKKRHVSLSLIDEEEHEHSYNEQELEALKSLASKADAAHKAQHASLIKMLDRNNLDFDISVQTKAKEAKKSDPSSSSQGIFASLSENIKSHQAQLSLIEDSLYKQCLTNRLFDKSSQKSEDDHVKPSKWCGCFRK